MILFGYDTTNVQRRILTNAAGALQVVMAAGSAAIGKVGLQVGGADVSGTNPVPVVARTRVARAAHSASAALPPAGAYTSQTAYVIPDGVTNVVFYVTYTRGGAAGQPKFKLLAGNGTEEGPLVIVDSSVTLSEPLGRQNLRGGEFLGPIPVDDTAIQFVIPAPIRGGITTIRLLVAEHGNTGAPGTAAVALTAGYE